MDEPKTRRDKKYKDGKEKHKKEQTSFGKKRFQPLSPVPPAPKKN
jgi:hypothetical protein